MRGFEALRQQDLSAGIQNRPKWMKIGLANKKRKLSATISPVQGPRRLLEERELLYLEMKREEKSALHIRRTTLFLFLTVVLQLFYFYNSPIHFR